MAMIDIYIRLRDGFSFVMEKISRATENIIGKITELRNVAQSATGSIKNIFAGTFLANMAMQGLETIKTSLNHIVQIAEEYSGIKARLNLIASSQENVAYLNNMIYESAQRASGSYMDMAKSVAQLSMSAKDAFPDPREAVTFMEGVQKLFSIGGTSTENQKFAMIQLTQGLTSGVLQGDEFRSIAENAPLIENMIAKEMGVSRSALKELSSDGEITAQIVKNAILHNMDEINAQFAKMPTTWGDHFNHISNVATQSFAPVFDRLSALANSDSVKVFINNIEYGITLIAPMFYVAIGAVQKFIDITSAGLIFVGNVFNGIADIFAGAGNAIEFVLSMILGLIMSVAFAVTVATGAWAFWNTVQLIFIAYSALQNAALIMTNAQLAIAYIRYGLVTTATALWSLVTGGLVSILKALNLTLLMNPIGIVITLVVLIISAFVGWKIASYGLRNTLAEVFSTIAETVASAINFMIDRINGLISAFNAIKRASNEFFHTNFSDTQEISYRADKQVFQNSAREFVNDFKLENVFKMPKPEVPTNFDTSVIPKSPVISTSGNDNDSEKDTNGKRTADNTQKIADKIEMTAEEIRELREVAMQGAINTWNDQHIIVNIENNNSINSDADIDGMTSNLVKGIEQAIQLKQERAVII